MLIPLRLRLEMIVLAVAFILFVFHTVNRKRLQMRYSVLWILVSVALIVVAFFPQLAVWLSLLAGIKTLSNFLYLMAIFVVLCLAFSLSLHLSRVAEQTKRTIQIVSIERYFREQAAAERRPAGKE